MELRRRKKADNDELFTKTISRFGRRMSVRDCLANSSSEAPSSRLTFVAAEVAAFRLLVLVTCTGRGLLIIVENEGRGEILGETTFIIGEMIFFALICSFSFVVVEIVSRLSDSRSFERNTSATSSEPNVVFNALNLFNSI